MIYKVLDVINEAESNFIWDVEANGHHYNIEYKNNKLILKLINEYSYYDECDDLQYKSTQQTLKEFDCSSVEFVNFTIDVYETKIDIIRSDYNYFGEYENGYLIPKIQIKRIYL